MKKTAKAMIIPALVGTLGFVSSPLAREAWSIAAEVVLPKLSPQGLLSLVATISILCLSLSIALYTSNSKRLLQGRYEHLENRGFWIHRKTEQKVCGSCLLAGLESPLASSSFPDANGRRKNIWVCGNKACGIDYFFDETKDWA